MLQSALSSGVHHLSHTGEQHALTAGECECECPTPQALALIELHKAPKGLYKNEVYLLPKKMGRCCKCVFPSDLFEHTLN